MFDWVLNTLLSLDGYYLYGLSSLYVRIVAPECFKNVVSRIQFIFETQFFFLFWPEGLLVFVL